MADLPCFWGLLMTLGALCQVRGDAPGRGQQRLLIWLGQASWQRLDYCFLLGFK